MARVTPQRQRQLYQRDTASTSRILFQVLKLMWATLLVLGVYGLVVQISRVLALQPNYSPSEEQEKVAMASGDSVDENRNVDFVATMLSPNKREEGTSHTSKLHVSHQALKWQVDPVKRNPQCRRFNHAILHPEHGCQVNLDTYVLYCAFQNLQVNVSKVKSDRGGEPLESVMGRDEAPEFPRYSIGAFTVSTQPILDIPSNYKVRHYQADVLNSMVYPTKTNNSTIESACKENWSGTTLFITRYEYVNLYHTMTDWWNAYFVMPHNEKVRVVFLDAHAQGNLDPVWTALFGPASYIQHLPKGGVCFEKAVFVPPGYLAPIYPPTFQVPKLRCVQRDHADAFSNFVLKSYDLDHVKMIPGRIVIIDRKPHVSHPRSNPDKLSRVISNLPDVEQRIAQLDHVSSVEIVKFETMSFGQQLKIVREANILIGNHGAGLTHLLFLDKGASLLEFKGRNYQNFFFVLSEWREVQYATSTISQRGSDALSPQEMLQIVAQVKNILED